MEIRTPIIAILVLIILIIVYLRENIPQNISSRVFFCFLIAMFINLVSEIFECAVFLYLGNSFITLRRVSQSFYVSTLIFCAYLMNVYVYVRLFRSRVTTWKIAAITVIPSILAVISLFVGKVYYTTNDSGEYYTYGSVVTFCYFIGFLYIFSTMLSAIIFRKRLRKEDSLAIIAGLVIWVLLAFFQLSFRGYQVSAVAMMLMALILFLAMENPKEYYEKNIEGVKNRDAFSYMLVEKFANKKPFFIISVIFTGKSNVISGAERRELYGLEADFARIAEQNTAEPAYLSEWNTLSFLSDTPEKVEQFMSLVANYRDDGDNYKLTFAVLEAPKYVNDADKALQIISYVSTEYIYTQSSPNLVIDDRVIDRMNYRNSIEIIVREAVRNKTFEVYYQPILCVNGGEFKSAEALVRLKRPSSENYISPEDFIPVAEKCGLIQEIDDLVFEKVCSFIARENLQSYGVKTIEVNLSGNEVVDRHTFSRLIRKMEKYHIPPKFINFEITETAYINNDDVFKENVQKLKEIGSSFSMDDFGSGYSNLLELLKMDYVLVKMDKEFIWNCLDLDKPENMRMLEYSIGFLKDYGLHILAEGVETVEQAEILISKGVEYLQGFYYSRPIPENEYIEFLKVQKGEK